MAKKIRKMGEILSIRRSCLTGNAVWINKAPSKQAVWRAYWRACKREVERVARWGETVERRKENLRHLIHELMASASSDEPSPGREAAARRLNKLSEENVACHKGFYDHIVEERRRRKETLEIHRQMKEREKNTQCKL